MTSPKPMTPEERAMSLRAKWSRGQGQMMTMTAPPCECHDHAPCAYCCDVADTIRAAAEEAEARAREPMECGHPRACWVEIEDSAQVAETFRCACHPGATPRSGCTACHGQHLVVEEERDRVRREEVKPLADALSLLADEMDEQLDEPNATAAVVRARTALAAIRARRDAT